MALLVFFVLASALLLATGNLHIGPVAGGSTDEHGREEHADAEEACTSCPEDVQAPNEDKSDPDACAGCAEEEQGHDAHDADAEGHSDDNDPDGHDADADDHDGHDHAAVPDVEAIFSINCEHNCPIVECDECRYEVGVVKINAGVTESLIETQPASLGSLSEELKLTGTVELDQTRLVEIASAGKGRVIRIEKLLGQKVKEGDILAVIHSAQLGRAKAEYLETLSALELAQITFNREKKLYEKKITSQDDYLKAQNQLRTAQACLIADEKELNLFGMTADQIAAISDEKQNGQFAQLILIAPADGTIIEQNITVGKLVDTTDSLYKIADLSNLWVWCDLYEKNLAQIHKLLAANGSLKAKLHVKAFEETFAGSVDLITSTLDTETRTVRMRVQVANTDNMLKPGMFAEVAIPVGESATTLMVPKTAVMTDQKETFVFQHLKDDLWLRRDVVTGKEADGHVEIIKGLTENAQIVTKGAFMFKSDVLREKMGAGCAH